MEYAFSDSSGPFKVRVRQSSHWRSSPKFYRSDIHIYDVIGQSHDRYAAGTFDRCAVSTTRVSEWKGYYGTKVPGMSEAWSSKTALGRVKILNDEMKESYIHSDDGKGSRNSTLLIDTGIHLFGSNGVLDYALMEPSRHLVKHLGFGLGRVEVIRASKQLFSALRFLHDRGIVHANINVDAVTYRPSDGKFRLTDLFCLHSSKDFSNELYGSNQLYAWQRSVLSAIAKTSELYQVTRMLADMVALISVLKYSTSLDGSGLLKADPLGLHTVRPPHAVAGEESHPISGEESHPISGEESHARDVRSIERMCSGEADMDVTLQWIAYQHGMFHVHTHDDADENYITPKHEDALNAFVKVTTEMEDAIDTACKFRDHPMYPLDLLSRLHREPGENEYGLRLKRRLSLIYHKTTPQSDMWLNSFYLPTSISLCYASICKAASAITSLNPSQPCSFRKGT